MQVVEYIMQHYTWFLGGAILILLAIIGYFADKTNFGQGKTSNEIGTTKEQDNNENYFVNNPDINNQETIVEKSEILESQRNDKKNMTEVESNMIELGSQENALLKYDDIQEVSAYDNRTVSVEQNYGDLSSDIISNNVQNIETDVNDNIIESNQVNVSVNEKRENSDSYIFNHDEIKKFDDEFNLLLPKKELITDDLLSDIDDLELGKTKKLEFSDVPDLDDIELPKIKNMVNQEDDIWKF